MNYSLFLYFSYTVSSHWMWFGMIIKDELKARGISQRKFSSLTGISYTLLNEILNGKRPVSADMSLLLLIKFKSDTQSIILKICTNYPESTNFRSIIDMQTNTGTSIIISNPYNAQYLTSIFW